MTKRRANGEGNLRKRKDGRWEGRYTAGHDPETGKELVRQTPDQIADALASLPEQTRLVLTAPAEALLAQDPDLAGHPALRQRVEELFQAQGDGFN